MAKTSELAKKRRLARLKTAAILAVGCRRQDCHRQSLVVSLQLKEMNRKENRE
jgi:hypothetical protein